MGFGRYNRGSQPADRDATGRSSGAAGDAPSLREPRSMRAAVIVAHWPLWLLGGHAVWLILHTTWSAGPLRAAPDWLAQGVPLLGILLAVGLACKPHQHRLAVAPTPSHVLISHLLGLAVAAMAFVAACVHGSWMALAGWGGQLLLASAVLASVWTAAALLRRGRRLRVLPSGVIVERHGDLLLRLDGDGRAPLLRLEPPPDGGHVGMHLTLAALGSDSPGGAPYRTGLAVQRAPGGWEGEAAALARGAFTRASRWSAFALGSGAAWILLTP